MCKHTHIQKTKTRTLQIPQSTFSVWISETSSPNQSHSGLYVLGATQKKSVCTNQAMSFNTEYGLKNCRLKTKKKLLYIKKVCSHPLEIRTIHIQKKNGKTQQPRYLCQELVLLAALFLAQLTKTQNKTTTTTKHVTQANVYEYSKCTKKLMHMQHTKKEVKNKVQPIYDTCPNHKRKWIDKQTKHTHLSLPVPSLQKLSFHYHTWTWEHKTWETSAPPSWDCLP